MRARDLKSVDRKVVRVRLPPSAPIFSITHKIDPQRVDERADFEIQCSIKLVCHSFLSFLSDCFKLQLDLNVVIDH